MPPPTAKEIHDAIVAIPNPSATSTTKFNAVTQLIANLAGLAVNTVYTTFVSKPGNLSVRMQQRGPGVRRRLGVAVLPIAADLPNTVTAGRKQVGPNTFFDALVLYVPDASNQWTAATLIEPENGTLAALFKAVYPSIVIAHPVRPTSPPGPNVTALADELLLDPEWVRDVLWMLNDRKALVLYGPPGTGKTYIAQRIAEALQPSLDRRCLVQLHPSYSYEDFFEGYRPVLPEGGGLALDKRHGPLRRLAARAVEDPEQPVVLVLDEMNRGNLPKVFGELYFLLEYRDQATTLMYSPDEEFSLPSNLFLIGSMNTADRSIAMLDQALRRRFHFVGLFPGEAPVDGMLRKYLQKFRPQMIWVADLLAKANELLNDRNMAIGPSHFMRKDLDDAVLERVWRYSVLPSIEEQLFGETERIKKFALASLKASLPAAKQDGGT
jgi:MoxR-like ATPase